MALRAVDREPEVAVCVAHGVGGELGGHQLGGFDRLARLLAQDISDETTGGADGLGLTAKSAGAGHGSMASTLERPVVSRTRRMIGEGFRTDTLFICVAALISTAIPALSINRRPARSKISR
jgi:hypothetical protein